MMHIYCGCFSVCHSPVKDVVVTNDRWGSDTRCLHGDFYTCSDRYNPGESCDLIYIIVPFVNTAAAVLKCSILRPA